MTDPHRAAPTRTDPHPAAPLMTPQEVANHLGVRIGTLETWRRTGAVRLPFVKVGGLVRYQRADVERFIVDRTEVPKGKA